ncbi:MAG: PAS domain-containing protein [Sphingomonas sp.]
MKATGSDRQDGLQDPGKTSPTLLPQRFNAFGFERLYLSFKALGGGLWDYDIDTDTLICNDRWYEILGLDPRQADIGSIPDFKRHIHPDDVAIATEVDPEIVAMLISNDEPYHVEFRIVRPGGEIRWLRSVASVLRDDDTQHLRAVGCITDITEFRAGDRAAPIFGVEVSSDLADPVDPPERVADDIHADAEEGEGSLSERERECLLWVSVGKTAQETATIIGRSRRTVEFHLNNAVRKLQASNKVHATAIAIRKGLL